MTDYDLGRRLARSIKAQAVIAAKAVGAEVNLTPETIEAATEAADITVLPDHDVWRPGVRVEAGATVTYNGVTYECLQRHVTQSDWKPDNTPALWSVKQDESPPGEALPWIAGKAVKVGDMRAYGDGGKIYECLQGHTTQAGWEPPVVPALWREVD